VIVQLRIISSVPIDQERSRSLLVSQAGVVIKKRETGIESG